MKTLILLTSFGLLLTSCSDISGANRTMREPNTPRPSQTEASVSMPTPSYQSGTVTSSTRDILVHAYQEELLAHDVYTKLVAVYPGLSEVYNIIQSESSHQEQVGGLLDVRGIAHPTDYGSYGETYTVLSKMIDSSLTGAIEAGVLVETGDIEHLLEEYRLVPDNDIRMVFEKIGGGSYNHLRAFLRMAQTNNYAVVTSYSQYLSQDDIMTSGPLQYKMTELLQSNNLPTYGGKNAKGRGNGQGRMMRQE